MKTAGGSGRRCRKKPRNYAPPIPLQYARAALGRPVAEIAVLAGTCDALACSLELREPQRALTCVRVAPLRGGFLRRLACTCNRGERMSREVEKTKHGTSCRAA